MAHSHQRANLSIDTRVGSAKSLSTWHDSAQSGRDEQPGDDNEFDEGDYDVCDDASSVGNDDEYLVMDNRRASRSHDQEAARLRKGLHDRGTTVRFDAVAHLDDGNEHDLDTPLPKPADHERQTMAIPIRTRPRRHSEAEKEDYDSTTGERLSAESQLHDSSRRIAYAPGQFRYPLVQSTVDELGQESRYAKHYISQKDTAFGRTFSTPANEDARAMSRSAILTPSTEYSPLSYLSQSTIIPSRRSVSQRSFGSLGSVGRRHQARSNGSSLTSPAHSFLSQWTRGDVPVKEPDPDDEGQEIGDNSGYIIGRRIGYGGFSVVKEATTLCDGQKLVRAVKIVRKNIQHRSEEENEKLQSDFEHEIGIWRYLQHVHILPLIAVYDTAFATFCITKLNQGGTLFDLVRTNRKIAADQKGSRGLSGKLAKRYLHQLASALRYLHEDVRVVHRDIKPENCLVDMSRQGANEEDGRILLCDFGMADFIHNDHRPDPSSVNTSPYTRKVNGTPSAANIGPAMSSTNIQGSLEYAAPELLAASDAVYSTAVDIWAYGCLAYLLLTGTLAFTDEFKPRLAAMVQKGNYNTSALEECTAVRDSGGQAATLVQTCLLLNPEERLNISQILEHDWFSDCTEIYDSDDQEA